MISSIIIRVSGVQVPLPLPTISGPYRAHGLARTLLFVSLFLVANFCRFRCSPCCWAGAKLLQKLARWSLAGTFGKKLSPINSAECLTSDRPEITNWKWPLS